MIGSRDIGQGNLLLLPYVCKTLPPSHRHKQTHIPLFFPTCSPPPIFPLKQTQSYPPNCSSASMTCSKQHSITHFRYYLSDPLECILHDSLLYSVSVHVPFCSYYQYLHEPISGDRFIFVAHVFDFSFDMALLL